jgi:hypothetical protein
MDELREWIRTAEVARPTCQNKHEFDLLIEHQKSRLPRQQREVIIPTAEIARDVSNFMIGFGIINVRNNVEHVVSAGSGTLVTVGSIHGILTAGHVLKKDPQDTKDARPDNGDVAIILHFETPEQFRRITLGMERTQKLVIRENRWPNGSDLGFLRLSENDAAMLGAISSFYNVTKHRDDVLANRLPSPDSTDAIVGIIHERTTVLPARKTQPTSFESIFCLGKSSAIRFVDGYDLFDFEVTNTTDFPLPSSFEGASGGALWRFYLAMKNDAPSVVERRLMGVPFHQSQAGDGKTAITCHGPKSIYAALVAAINKEWPCSPRY